MSHRFASQLENVCQSRRWRHWMASTCWAIAAALVVTLAMMGLDCALGVSDMAGRIFLTLVFAGLLILILRRWQLSVYGYSMTPLQVAHDVEQLVPALRNTVCSAWEFARKSEGDPWAGSESLRRAVVLRAGAAVEQVDWQRLIPRKPLQRSVFGLTLVAMAITLLNWWLPQALGTGILRLTNPMNDAEWPREHHLQFIDPPVMLAAGDDLVLQLQDTHGQLPAEIVTTYRTRRRGRWVEKSVALATTENPQEVRLASVQEPLQFRATGGDHQTMPWHTLEVLPAPRLVDWTLTVNPPAYTFSPSFTWDRHAAILAGCRLELQGRIDQPIESMALQSALGAQVTAEVDPDGNTFQLDDSAWYAVKSDTYHFRVTTRAGLQTELETLLTLDVVDDQPPQVRFVQPISDLLVLPSTALPLAIEVTDDLAVQEIGLTYQRTDRPDLGEQALSLWRSAADPSLSNAIQQRRVEYLWQLEPLNLQADTVVEVHVQATDYQPALGRTSQPLRLFVVTEAELWQQLLQRQDELSVQLTHLVSEQRKLRSMSAVWEELPNWTVSRWAAASHTALFNQRQIHDALAIGQHSALERIKDLQQTMERNRLIRPDVINQLIAVKSILEHLVDGQLEQLELTMSEMVRQTQGKVDQAKLRPLISTTAELQTITIERLQRAIALLLPGSTVGRLEEELSAIEVDQAALNQHCRREVAPAVFQGDRLDQAAQITLAEAGGRQRELARRLAEWLLNAKQAADRLADSEPLLAARLSTTVALGENLGILSTIQAATEQLALGRVGRSTLKQQQVLEDLAELRGQLSGQSSQGAAQRLLALQSAEKELRRIRDEIGALERELSQLRAEEPIEKALQRVRRQLQKLAQPTRQIAANLERLQVPRAAQPTRDAAVALRRDASDAESVQQARQQIEVAQRELAAARRRQRVAMAQQEMAKLDAKLGAFLGRQQAIQEEITHLARNWPETEPHSGPVNDIATQVADRQHDLEAEVRDQAGKLQALPVFAFLLRSAGDSMRSVAEQLRQSELGQPVQEAAATAVRQLSQLAEALQRARQSLSSTGDRPTGQSQGPSGDKAQAETLELALGQLRLLRSLQSALREKTAAYEGDRTSRRPLTEVAKELARQQGQLIELARQLDPAPADTDDLP